MKHLFRQADRYGRLARELDGRGDRTFLRSMADGYREQAERAASALKRH